MPSLDNENSSLAIQHDYDLSLPSQPVPPLATQGTQPSRLNYETAPRERPATAGNYHSFASDAFSTTSSLDHDLSQLAIQYDQPSSPQSIKAQTVSSDAFSTTSSLNYDLSQLAIQHDRPSSPKVITAQNAPSFPGFSDIPEGRSSPIGSYCSSSSEVLSSTSSFDRQLTQLASQQDQPLSLHPYTAGRTHSPEPSSQIGLGLARPGTAGSYYSSSSEVLSLGSDVLESDFSQPAIEDNTPFSSQSTNPEAHVPRLDTQDNQPEQYSETDPDFDSYFDSDSSIQSVPLRQRQISSQTCDSPSSTGKLTYSFPSPILPPTTTQTQVQSSLAMPLRSPRLYRTRSGNLATAAELRGRRDLENVLLDVVLDGIQPMIIGNRPSSQKRSIAVCLDESGRWRICSVWEPWGP